MRHSRPSMLLLAGLLLVVAFGTGARCIVGRTVRVIDGSTFDVIADVPLNWGDDCPVVQGQEYRVKLIGVQVPDCYQQQATAYLTELLANKRVCLMRDQSCRDAGGNLLAYVWVDTDPSNPGCELFVNADIVEKGYANAAAASQDSTLLPLIEGAECLAYARDAGLWNACPEVVHPPYCRVVGRDQLPVTVKDIRQGSDGKYYVPDRGDGCAYMGERSGNFVGLWAPNCDVGWDYNIATGTVNPMLP
jgi:endonuclease YncB( thermonuclease family)